MTRKKIFENLPSVILYIFLMAIVGLFSYYFYAISWPYKVLTVNSVTVVGDNLKPGDSLDYIADYCKYMDIAPTVYRDLVDGVIYNLNSADEPTRKTNNPVGCHKIRMHAGHVPDVAGGKYKLMMRNVYKVNAFRDITISFETPEFTIIGDEKVEKK